MDLNPKYWQRDGEICLANIAQIMQNVNFPLFGNYFMPILAKIYPV